MKFLNKYAIFCLALGFMMAGCKEDDVKDPGNPVMEYQGLPATVYFGDNLPFTVKATDSQVPLYRQGRALYR